MTLNNSQNKRFSSLSYRAVSQTGHHEPWLITLVTLYDTAYSDIIIQAQFENFSYCCSFLLSNIVGTTQISLVSRTLRICPKDAEYDQNAQ